VRILSHIRIKDRPDLNYWRKAMWIVTVKLEAREPKSGKECLKRLSDGRSWLIVGVEWWTIPRRPRAGDTVGLAVRDDECPMVGDEVEIVYEDEA
jgi:hypothetical protein